MRPKVNLEYGLTDEIWLEIERRAKASGDWSIGQRIALELMLTKADPTIFYGKPLNIIRIDEAMNGKDVGDIDVRVEHTIPVAAWKEMLRQVKARPWIVGGPSAHQRIASGLSLTKSISNITYGQSVVQDRGILESRDNVKCK
jgi:hypothetical protein